MAWKGKVKTDNDIDDSKDADDNDDLIMIIWKQNDNDYNQND